MYKGISTCFNHTISLCEITLYYKVYKSRLYTMNVLNKLVLKFLNFKATKKNEH